jgi:polysaccharide biosynthesis PFTS motif protein
MVGPEFIVEIPAIKSRINRQSEVLITTQSQLLSTPLVFKSNLKAGRVMYWYSNNSMQITKQKSVNLDYSYLSQSVISEHFVWTSTWGKFLEERNTNAVITVIGPILFKNLSKYGKSEKINRSQTKKLLIFDVTPKKNAGEDSIYSEKEMTQFVSDIAGTTTAVYSNALIKLKPKRKYTSDDSIAYCDFLEANSSSIQILKWDSDIGNEISKSDLVICVPYSSPALIAKHLGIPTIFYTPSLDFKLDPIHEDILVVQGSTELRRFLEKLDN